MPAITSQAARYLSRGLRRIASWTWVSVSSKRPIRNLARPIIVVARARRWVANCRGSSATAPVSHQILLSACGVGATNSTPVPTLTTTRRCEPSRAFQDGARRFDARGSILSWPISRKLRGDRPIQRRNSYERMDAMQLSTPPPPPAARRRDERRQAGKSVSLTSPTGLTGFFLIIPLHPV